jgi:hypothetical protein
MHSADTLKAIRVRRERLFKRSNPRIRQLDMARDAWVLWAAYDLASFPTLKAEPTKEGVFKNQEQFFEYFRAFSLTKSSLLVVDQDHKFFRDKRGPVALISLDNYGGWRIEPQFEFFHWATKRQRLACVVSFLQMVRYSRDVGVCVVRVNDADVPLCEHIIERYDLLRPCGKIPNASADGTQHLFYVKGRRQQQRQLQEAA